MKNFMSNNPPSYDTLLSTQNFSSKSSMKWSLISLNLLLWAWTSLIFCLTSFRSSPCSKSLKLKHLSSFYHDRMKVIISLLIPFVPIRLTILRFQNISIDASSHGLSNQQLSQWHLTAPQNLLELISFDLVLSFHSSFLHIVASVRAVPEVNCWSQHFVLDQENGLEIHWKISRLFSVNLWVVNMHCGKVDMINQNMPK